MKTLEIGWRQSMLTICATGRPADLVAFMRKAVVAVGFPGGLVVKNLPTDAGDARDSGSTPESRRFPVKGNGNPFQYSCLENPIDRGAWGLPSTGSQTVRHDLATEHKMALLREGAYLSSFRRTK